MPHTVSELRTLEHATQAYILLLDGINIAFTTDTSGELTFTGASGYLERSEAAAPNEFGGREMREGLRVPGQIEFGDGVSGIGLGRTFAKFSVLLEPDIAEIFLAGGEEPISLPDRIPPTDSPTLAIQPTDGDPVTVADRYVNLERIGPGGERRLYPFMFGEELYGFDHMGITAGGEIPTSSVSTKPLMHEGRLVSLYRIYRDPSADSEIGSLAWPDLTNYHPIWVGKMRDTATIQTGGRMTIECTGFESLLERNMATVGGRYFPVTPLPKENQRFISIACGTYGGQGILTQTGNPVQSTSRQMYQGRNFVELTAAGFTSTVNEINTLISNTVNGIDTDYNTSAPTMAQGVPASSIYGGNPAGDAGIESVSGFWVRALKPPGGPNNFFDYQDAALLYITMHDSQWAALGYDTTAQHVSQTDLTDLSPEDRKYAIEFTRVSSSSQFDGGVPGAPSMSPAPGSGYVRGKFHTIKTKHSWLDGFSVFNGNKNSSSTQGEPRYFKPKFPPTEAPAALDPKGGNILSTPVDPVVMPQPNFGYTGSIGGTPCNAAGLFLIKGKLRPTTGQLDNKGQLIIGDETDQVAIAHVSWIARKGVYPDYSPTGGGTQLYVEKLVDPRLFGYPFAPFDGPWKSQEFEMAQIRSWLTADFRSKLMNADALLSILMRSTGTSPGPQPGGLMGIGENSDGVIPYYSDLMSADMGLGLPGSLCPTQEELEAAFQELDGTNLRLMLPAYEGSFPSFDVLRAILEPRGRRIGFHGGRFTIYELSDVAFDKTDITIGESDLYGEMGDPTTVYPRQAARALAPVDVWEIKAGENTHTIKARDPGAAMRRGNVVRQLNGKGLIQAELYRGDTDPPPKFSNWKNEAEILFGNNEARFLARRHGMVTVNVSRPKGQDIYPGTTVTLSNPWVYGQDGSQGVSSVAGRVFACRHNLKSGACEADILVFEGQQRPRPRYAPMLWLQQVVSSTNLLIADPARRPRGFIGSKTGWTKPEWATGGGNNGLSVVLIRMLPDGTWTEVGTSVISSVTDTNVFLAQPLSALPPKFAYTMILVPDVWDNQPEWAQEIYVPVGRPALTANSRRFI